jgi:hypothetical protein
MWRMLLAHHPEEQADRCLQLGGIHLCRRCTWLYPLTFVLMLLQLTPFSFPSRWDAWLPLLALPTILDFTGEQLGWLSYRPLRVVLGSLLLALPLGRGFGRYLLNPLDPWFWSLVIGGAVPTVGAYLWKSLRSPAS